jgi:hypothetical protein
MYIPRVAEPPYVLDLGGVKHVLQLLAQAAPYGSGFHLGEGFEDLQRHKKLHAAPSFPQRAGPVGPAVLINAPSVKGYKGWRNFREAEFQAVG